MDLGTSKSQVWFLYSLDLGSFMDFDVISSLVLDLGKPKARLHPPYMLGLSPRKHEMI